MPSKASIGTKRTRRTKNPINLGEYWTGGTIRNMDAFYEAFDVKEGDGMYLPPEERVEIW